MVTRLLGLALVFIFPLSGCILNPEGPFSQDAADAGMVSPELESEYTHMQKVFMDGKQVGYLLTFLEVPRGSKARQHIKPHTRYIKDLDFKNIGFILPQGKTYRFDQRQKAEEVCQFELEKNLAHFFGKPFAKIELHD